MRWRKGVKRLNTLVVVLRDSTDRWVGDGFSVRTLFPCEQLGEKISPSCSCTAQDPIASSLPSGCAALVRIRIAVLKR